MLQLFHKKQQFLAVSYATILHCLVDFCCIYLMMQFVFPACRSTSLSNWLLYTMLYNFIAFAGQLPVGIFGDWLQRNRNLIAIGLLFLLVAYCGTWFRFPLLLIVLLLGIGNACFHVGGGRAAMEWKENACQPVGIFVATGAFGVLDCSNDCGFECGIADSTDFLSIFRRTKLAKTGIFHETDARQLVVSHGILLYLCCCASFFCRKCHAFSMGKKLACIIPNACNRIGKSWWRNSC